MKTFTVLFVCKANMCRSPSAHGVLRKKIIDHGLDKWLTVDSASTHNYYPNSPPDARSQEHAVKRGYDLSDLRARHIQETDFEKADLILVMDGNNLDMLQDFCPPTHRGKLRRLTEFCLTHGTEAVPDPFYGGHADFEYVLDLVEDACEGLIRHLRASHFKTGAEQD